MTWQRINWYRRAIREIGMLSVVQWQIGRHLPGTGLIKLTTKYLRHPLFARPSTTDMMMFHQCFIEHEYAPFDDLDPTFVVDCGAYVGYSSAYFLSRFPHCKVICIEPAPDNFEMLRMNLAPYLDRVTLINGAVWPRDEHLRFQQLSLKWREWGRRVEAGNPGDGVKGVTISSILPKAARIGLLKIDIEGSEVALFQANTAWLDLVDNIAIELHGDDCTQAFNSVVLPRSREVLTFGELTFCRLAPPN